jgi:DNA-binding NtrC family response regulator
MPTRVTVVHDDASIRTDLVNALVRAGYEAVGFADTRTALPAIEADQHIAMLITRVSFRVGMPHGVSLALMLRSNHRSLKILFLAQPKMVEYAEGVGEILVSPVPTEAVMAKVREMLSLSA